MTVLLVQRRSPSIVLPPIDTFTFDSDTVPWKLLPPQVAPEIIAPPPIRVWPLALLKLDSPSTSFPQITGREPAADPFILMPPSILAVQMSTSKESSILIPPLIFEVVPVGTPAPDVVALTSTSPPSSTKMRPLTVLVSSWSLPLLAILTPPSTVTPLRMQTPSTSSPPWTREPGAGVPPLGHAECAANALVAKRAITATATTIALCIFLIFFTLLLFFVLEVQD